MDSLTSSSRDVYAAFQKTATDNPTAEAVVFLDRHSLTPHVAVTYSTLLERVNELSNTLRSTYQLQADQWVGVFMPPSVHLLPAVLAVMECGATYVPLDPTMPAARTHKIIRGAGIKLVLTLEHLLIDAIGAVDDPTLGVKVCTVDALKKQSEWLQQQQQRQAGELPVSLKRVSSRSLTQTVQSSRANDDLSPPLSPFSPTQGDDGWDSVVSRSRSTFSSTASSISSICSEVPAFGVPTTSTSASNYPAGLAYVIYTSGSTGQPKGVMLGATGLLHLCKNLPALLNLQPGRRVLQFASLAFDASIWEIFPTMLSGATLILAPRTAVLPGPELLATLEAGQVNVLTINPSSISILSPFANTQMTALDTIVVAGEACGLPLAKAWTAAVLLPEGGELHRRFFNAYGPTETTVCATIHQYSEKLDVAVVPIGNADQLPYLQVHLLDDEQRDVKAGEAGEIYVSGSALALGYVDDAALTAAYFVQLPHHDNIRAYRTRDRATYSTTLSSTTANKELVFAGRADTQVKIRGYRVEMGEVESLLQRHEDVDAVIVFYDAAAVAIVAIVVPVRRDDLADSTGLTKDLQLYLRSHLADYAVPSTFVAVEGLPLAANGSKVDRDRAIRNYAQGRLRGDSMATIAANIAAYSFRASISSAWSEHADQLGRSASVSRVDSRRSSASQCQSDAHLSRRQSVDSLGSPLMTPQGRPRMLSTMELAVREEDEDEDEEEQAVAAPVDSTAQPATLTIDGMQLSIAQHFATALSTSSASVTADSSFFSLGGSSLLAASMIGDIRRELGVDISIALLYRRSTPCQLAAYIYSKQQQSNQPDSDIQPDGEMVERVELSQEATLPPHIRPANPSAEDLVHGLREGRSAVLLTGATGFLGIYMLHDLLERAEAGKNGFTTVITTVRGSDERGARQRVLANFAKYDLHPTAASLSHLEVVVGDLSLHNLGLSDNDYHAVAQRIGCIYHAAADVSYVKPYTAATDSTASASTGDKPAVGSVGNVSSTQCVLSLACSAHPAGVPLHYVSTLAVFGAARCFYGWDVITEDMDPRQCEPLMAWETGYTKSKWVAEMQVKECYRRGLPVCVYRTGFIEGARGTGQSNTGDFFCRLIKSCIQLRCYPDMPHKQWQPIPVDYVAQSITHISLHSNRTGSLDGQSFHVVPASELGTTDLFGVLRGMGYALQAVSFQVWLDEISRVCESGDESNALYPLSAFVTQPFYCQRNTLLQMHLWSPRADQSKLRFALRSSPTLRQLPVFDAEALGVYMSYYIRTGFIQSPKKQAELDA